MRILQRLTNSLDWVAGWIVLASMFLVAGNVVLRPFNYPIAGTFEWTGFLTALAIGLGLAHCAAKGGHTVIAMLVDLFPRRVRLVDRVLVRALTAAFLTLAAWRVAVYADSTWKSGEVAPTTKIPFHPIMFVVAGAILIYALVEAVKVVELLRVRDAERISIETMDMPDTCPVPQAETKDDEL